MKHPRTIDLTRKERRKLNDLLIGYGNLTKASESTGLHINTLSRVNSLGYGTPETIQIIRSQLFKSAEMPETASKVAAVMILLSIMLTSCILTGKRAFIDKGPMPGGKTIRQGMNPQSHLPHDRVRYYKSINSNK